ncbi:MAG: hypothetical protein Fur0032_13420 [Terrimicrobiaceae bacterium]
MDASGPAGVVAVVEEGQIIRSVEFGGGRSRGGGAAAAIEQMADEDGLHGVVVGRGPGSYTGLRSSIASAWGFSLGRGIPLCGVSSLLALAPGEYFAVGDARRGQFYFAHIDQGCFVSEPVLVEKETLLATIEGNPGMPLFVPSPTGLPNETITSPRPEILAALANFEKSSTDGLCLPIYLKPPHITTPSGQEAFRPV